VQQALAQILDNAAKFTRNGHITVTAERRRDGPSEDILIAVRDTGIGIAREMVPALFEKFSVAEDATTSKYGGTGLGLALSQKLCRLMGGQISVETELGVGSCFSIRLPTAAKGGLTAERERRAEREAAETALSVAYAA
jgi:signal transduction histidine kinase